MKLVRVESTGDLIYDVYVWSKKKASVTPDAFNKQFVLFAGALNTRQLAALRNVIVVDVESIEVDL